MEKARLSAEQTPALKRHRMSIILILGLVSFLLSLILLAGWLEFRRLKRQQALRRCLGKWRPPPPPNAS